MRKFPGGRILDAGDVRPTFPLSVPNSAKGKAPPGNRKTPLPVVPRIPCGRRVFRFLGAALSVKNTESE